VSVAVQTLSGPPGLARIFATTVVTDRLKRSKTLPENAFRLVDVAVDRDHLADYQRLCGWDVGDALPHTYPHVLGFPLQVRLMGGTDFPLPLAGLVHVANEITVHRRLTAEDVLTVTVSARDLRPHPKGRLVDLVTEVDVEGERVWDGRSTYLHRGRPDPEAGAEGGAPAFPSGRVAAVWRLRADLGRRYGAVSGDVNPIHLHPLTAKAMGFPTAIAHGMWSYARTLAALGPGAGAPSTSRVWFRKPVLLPGSVALVVDPTGRPVVAGLRSPEDETREHLVLTLEPRA
jgi:acyl dehydratase